MPDDGDDDDDDDDDEGDVGDCSLNHLHPRLRRLKP